MNIASRLAADGSRSDEDVFTAAQGREVRVSADRRTITHRAATWVTEYSLEQFLFWHAWHERKFAMQPRPDLRADVEVLRAAWDLLVKEGVLS